MKNKITLIILVFISLLLIIRYFTIDYKIKYKIDEFDVVEDYSRDGFYFEIKDDEMIYNFDLKYNRGIFKKQISRIEKVSYEDEVCIYPIIKNKKTVPLCSKNGEIIAFYLLENENMIDFIKSIGLKKEELNNNDNFKFYNNLDKNEYISVYKYNGFYILNEDKIKSINLFNDDRYDNSLCFNKESLLILPDESEFIFKRFIVVDMKTNKHFYIDSLYDISFESDFLGYIKDKVYLLDNKNNKEYEIDLKKKEVKLIGDYEKGFKVYKDGKLKTGMISELKSNVFGIVNDKSLYDYILEDNKLYKIYKKNPDIKNLIYVGDARVLKTYKDEVFFLDNDMLFKYDSLNGIKIILINEEMNYNKTNFINIYINN